MVFPALMILYLGTYLLAPVVAVISTAGVLDKIRDSRNTTWATWVCAFSWFHYMSALVLGGYLKIIEKKLSQEDYETRGNWTTLLHTSLLICGWLVATVLGLAAGPSCDPASDWWKDLAAARDHRQRKFDMVHTCRMSVAVVCMSGIIAVSLCFIMLAMSVNELRKQVSLRSLIQYMRKGKTSTGSLTEEGEALLIYEA